MKVTIELTTDEFDELRYAAWQHEKSIEDQIDTWNEIVKNDPTYTDQANRSKANWRERLRRIRQAQTELDDKAAEYRRSLLTP